jgi:hypothetical protein
MALACSAAKADTCASLRAEASALKAARSPAEVQRQLQEAQSEAGQAGCSGGGGGFFFSLFGPPPSSRCSAILARVNRLQAMLASGGDMSYGDGYDLRRRQGEIGQALARLGCDSDGTGAGFGGSYRTLCVRTCDGYYFPIGYATNQSRFKTDAAVCKSMYPPGQADLYVHRTTDQDASQAVSLAGAPYAKQSFAFAYRNAFDRSCAALFRAGSGATVAISKAPVPPRIVASALTPPPLPRRLKPEASHMAAAEVPANLDPGLQNAVAGRANASGMRMVGPGLDGSSEIAATEGPPVKVAKPDATVAPAAKPVLGASLLPDLLDLLRGHKAAAASDPADEPDSIE